MSVIISWIRRVATARRAWPVGCRAVPQGHWDGLMDDRAASGPHPAVTAHAIGWNQGRHAKTPLSQGQGMCMTERAGAHSLQFGTYAFWTAGLLAALAVRPVPSCPASL